MRYNNIELARDGRVVVLTLNRPEKRNPISDEQTVAELTAAVADIQADPGVGALIITGAGTAFSSGGDVKAMQERSGIFAGGALDVADGYRRVVQAIPRALAGLDVPVIAAVNGPAVGAGCDLALMCDLCIASTAASFSQAFVNLGIIPGDGGAWFLVRRVGQQRAAELVLTGRTVDATEALAMGLVLKVVEPAALMKEAWALAEAIAKKPPQATRLAKRLLRQAGRVGLDDFLDICGSYQAMLHHTEDHQAAVAAMLEARKRRQC